MSSAHVVIKRTQRSAPIQASIKSNQNLIQENVRHHFVLTMLCQVILECEQLPERPRVKMSGADSSRASIHSHHSVKVSRLCVELPGGGGRGHGGKLPVHRV